MRHHLNSGHGEKRKESFKLIYSELKEHTKIFETRNKMNPLALFSCLSL